MKDFVELFSESNTRWIVEINEEDAVDFIGFMNERGCKAEKIGVTGGYSLDYGIASLDFDGAEERWRKELSRFLG